MRESGPVYVAAFVFLMLVPGVRFALPARPGVGARVVLVMSMQDPMAQARAPAPPTTCCCRVRHAPAEMHFPTPSHAPAAICLADARHGRPLPVPPARACQSDKSKFRINRCCVLNSTVSRRSFSVIFSAFLSVGGGGE